MSETPRRAVLAAAAAIPTVAPAHLPATVTVY
jgi:hypothetical protein